MTNILDLDRDARRLDAQLLSDLWTFRAAAHCGSVTAGAKRLGVTQGAVSQRVLRLEARLDVQLFVRNKGRLTLTEAGASLLKAMNQVAQVLNDTLSRVSGLERKAVVVSCVPSLATEWLVPHLDEFYRRCPGIEVFVRSELAPSTAERVDSERIDVVIDYQPFPAADMHELASIQEFVFPVCSRRYQGALKGDDGSYPPITLLHDDVPWWGGVADSEWSAWKQASGISWPGRTVGGRHFNLAHLAYHAAMFDQGIALGRSVIMNRLLSKGDLVAALDCPPVPGSTYRVSTTRPGDWQSPVQKFARWWADAMVSTQAHTLSLLGGTEDIAEAS